jgi:hypothetical protein
MSSNSKPSSSGKTHFTSLYQQELPDMQIQSYGMHYA